MKGGDARMNKQMDERKSPCVLQDFVPFGAAAQKANSRPEKADLRPERVDFSPDRADISPERALGDDQMNEQTDVKMTVFCVLQDFVPFRATAQEVMRGHNIVANGWAGASNPHLHLNPSQTYTKSILNTSVPVFRLNHYRPTDQ